MSAGVVNVVALLSLVGVSGVLFCCATARDGWVRLAVLGAGLVACCAVVVSGVLLAQDWAATVAHVELPQDYNVGRGGRRPGAWIYYWPYMSIVFGLLGFGEFGRRLYRAALGIEDH